MSERGDVRAATEPVRVSGGIGDVAIRARRWWPIGLAVAVVTALVGLALTWEAPRVFVTRATVYPPASVTSAVAGQRYAADLQAAVNSVTVRADVAERLGRPPSVLGEQLELRRIRQSSVMEAVMTTSERLEDPAQTVTDLVTRGGQSLSAPEVAAAEAQRARAEESVVQAEDAAVEAKGARDAFLRDRDDVTPTAELEILGPQLAALRLCASGAVVPEGADAATCRDQVAQLERTAETLAQEADELAALDRELSRAEAVVSDAQRELDETEAAVVRAGAGPVIEVSQAGDEVSQVPNLLRRSLAVVGGALLLGFAVVVALALLTHPEHHPQSARAPEGAGRARRAPP